MVAASDSENADEFEMLMERVGMKGKFQLRFNIVFNMIFALVFGLPTFNILLALSVPNHWCHVPGRSQTNHTLDQWKQLNIPKESDGVTFSKCSMYDDSYNITSCQHGWEYDTSWYKMTAPSQEDWVCDNELYATNAIFFSRVGEAVGSLILGQLADMYGRRPIMFFSVVLLAVGRSLTAFTSGMYYLFLVACFLGNTPTVTVYMSPLIIGVEMTGPRDRSHITMLQSIGWVCGICTVPAVAWITGGDWRILLVSSSLPCMALFLVHRWFPESPRWLAARGRIADCERVLRHISKVNGRELDEESLKLLQQLDKKKETLFGIASLFSSWRFAKNSCLVFSCVLLSHFIYYGLIILVTGMSGNPFLNFFLQGVIEFPGFIFGRILCDKFGRRWCQAFAYSMTAISCLIISIIINTPVIWWLQPCLVVCGKLFITMTVYSAYLLNTEMYPPCVRQAGSSVGFVVSSTIGVLVPYVAYLGTAVNIRYPYIVLAILAVLGVLSGLFLPETKDQQLPETLAEAAVFGKDQSFWNFPWRYRTRKLVPREEKAVYE